MTAQAVGMTPWVAVVVWLVSGLWFGDGLAVDRWLNLLVPVFIVDVMVVIMAWLIRRRTAAMARGPAANAEAPPPAIREKLPPKLARARLVAVAAEDHYLRIHTEAGDDLILMRLTDALEALKHCPGLRTHRSWWVARDAVEHAKFARGRGELTLANGLKVPVSRAYAPAVRETDWAS
jgi:DNA-binding LytR/AlgR family response regulator